MVSRLLPEEPAQAAPDGHAEIVGTIPLTEMTTKPGMTVVMPEPTVSLQKPPEQVAPAGQLELALEREVAEEQAEAQEGEP